MNILKNILCLSSLTTSIAFAAEFFDIAIVGGGASGTSAAIQAARMGSKVVIIEPTDWVGGQMTAAGVSTMDGFLPNNYAFGERGGIYRDFINRVKNYYITNYNSKLIATCYFDNQHECFEPRIGQLILNQMLAEYPPNAANGSIKVYLREKTLSAIKSVNLVTGIITDKRTINAKITIDATEYGDLLPLVGAKYRVGNKFSTDSQSSRYNACIQDITYLAIIRRYPRAADAPNTPGSGVPTGLLMSASPVPNSIDTLIPDDAFYQYSQVVPYFRLANTATGNSCFAYGGGNPFRMGPLASYRGLPDSNNPNNYVGSSGYDSNWNCIASPNTTDQITKTGLNLANDFPAFSIYYGNPLPTNKKLKAQYLEDAVYRNEMNCRAKLKTIQWLYYIQNEMGEKDWAPATDEGFDTNYNSIDNVCPANLIPGEFKQIERHLALMPYVREGRRLVGLRTLKSTDIVRSAHGTEPYKRSAGKEKTSVATGDYAMDLHNCDGPADMETDDPSFPANLNDVGPFQIPMEALIPETIDGFLAAEKNISVSRIVNGATRLQPSAMMIGQAAGVMAALSISGNIQPRNLNVEKVQRQLVLGGTALTGMPISAFKFTDISNTDSNTDPFWKYIQMSSAKGWMLGFGDGTFGMGLNFSRAPAASVAVRRFGKSTTPYLDLVPAPNFTDVTINGGVRGIPPFLRTLR